MKSDPRSNNFRTGGPDLILSNISRWPIGGWEFAEQVKTNPKTRAVSIVITSAQEYARHDQLRYGSLIVEYVYLPVGEEELCTVVDQVLRRCSHRK